MRKTDVKVGASYLAKVSGNVVPVRIVGVSRFGGWDAISERTGRPIRIKTAARLRSEAGENPRARAYLRMADQAHKRGDHELGNHWASRAKEVS